MFLHHASQDTKSYPIRAQGDRPGIGCELGAEEIKLPVGNMVHERFVPRQSLCLKIFRRKSQGREMFGRDLIIVHGRTSVAGLSLGPIDIALIQAGVFAQGEQRPATKAKTEHGSHGRR
jgi:hypothetical protein